MFTKEYDHFESSIVRACGFTDEEHFHALVRAYMNIFEESNRFSHFVQMLEKTIFNDKKDTPLSVIKAFRVLTIMLTPLFKERCNTDIAVISLGDAVEKLKKIVGDDLDELIKEFQESETGTKKE